ncbi:hypothetical protein HYV49_02915, partial [Candidatus Pacearchaeota archaeon]|nr:hypothetical protein [Candidatus Pacearchaeota archaeon]
MAYKKYIKKNGKTYGPYIYHSKRIGNKVVSNYIGKHDATSNNDVVQLDAKELNNINEISFLNRFLNRKYLSFFIIILFVIGLIILIKFVPIAPSGRVALQIDKEFKSGEPIDGFLRLQMKRGEFLPKDSIVRVKLDGQEKSIKLEDILGSAKEGNFFAENVNIEGSGEGYGFAGEKRIYPDVSFQIVIKRFIELPEESPEKPAEEKPEEEPKKEEPVEEPKEEKPETPEQPAEPSAESETSAEPSAEVPSEPGITGAVILEEEEVIEASINYLRNFSYSKKENERVEIRNVRANGNELSPSVILIDEKANQFIFYTNYFESEQGFGREYLIDETREIEIGLGQFGIVASKGELEIAIVYNDITIIEAKKDIKIVEEKEEQEEIKKPEAEPREKPEANITNVTIINVTEVNITNITGINITEVNETGIITNETNITTEIANVTISVIQGVAVIGQPVEWEKRIEGEGRIKVDVPDEAEDIVVQKISKDESKELEGEEIGISGQIISEVEIGKEGVLLRFFKKLFSIFTGRVVQDINDVDIEISETEIAIVRYTTPGPEAKEEIISSHKKRIVVSGPDEPHYENVLAFTTLEEFARKPASVKVYWIEKGEFIDSSAKDNDGNGFIDYVEWNIPSLSEQTFEITITILNVQSYPTVGGNWTV